LLNPIDGWISGILFPSSMAELLFLINLSRLVNQWNNQTPFGIWSLDDWGFHLVFWDGT